MKWYCKGFIIYLNIGYKCYIYNLDMKFFIYKLVDSFLEFFYMLWMKINCKYGFILGNIRNIFCLFELVYIFFFW